MANSTRILAVTTALGLASSVWLYLDNRSLEADIAQKSAEVKAADQEVAAARASGWDAPSMRSAKIPSGATPEPTLPAAPREHRLDRRQRRTEEFAAMFGRQEGETEEEYKARIGPMITMGLAARRLRVTDNRRIAEEKAGVTREQSAKLDKAFEKVYGDVLDYTNKAIQDGTLTPYERNVAGWLDFAGGLGGLLNETQNNIIGKILTPEQIKAMTGSGFEWGEYLGFNAPWENITPPPPRQ
jgi:hypothetical protein